MGGDIRMEYSDLLCDFKIIESLLPIGWRQKAYELKAIVYSRNIRNVEDLLKLILLYLTSGKSYGMTAAMTQLSLGFKMTKNGVYERIQRCGDWLSWMCENICRNAGLIVEKPEWLANYRVCLVDATKVSLKGSKKADWCLNYMLDLFRLDTIEMHLKSGEYGETLLNFDKMGMGDIIVGDRMYGTSTSIEYAILKGADYCLRLRSKAFNLYDENGERIILEDKLSDMESCSYRDLRLFRKSMNSFVPIRLCVYRKSEEESNKSLIRIKRSNSKKMRGKVSKLQEFYSNYVIISTSLYFEVENIVAIYRLRWEIEILFKRLKSIFGYDEIPTKNACASRSWLNGKLLLFAICEALVNRGRFSP